MSAELVEEALKLPKYRQQIEDSEIQVPVRDDPRTDDKQRGLVKTMRESHYEPKASSRPEGYDEEVAKQQATLWGPEPEEGEDVNSLPKTYSRENEDRRRVATRVYGVRLPREERDRLFYGGMTEEEVLTWIADQETELKAKRLNTARTPISDEEDAQLMLAYRRGEITKREYMRLSLGETVQEGEEKEVMEMQSRGDLLKAIGEQDDRLKKMEEMMSQMAAMMSVKS